MNLAYFFYLPAIYVKIQDSLDELLEKNLNKIYQKLFYPKLDLLKPSYNDNEC
jgi:hypothetical protein